MLCFRLKTYNAYSLGCLMFQRANGQLPCLTHGHHVDDPLMDPKVGGQPEVDRLYSESPAWTLHLTVC